MAASFSYSVTTKLPRERVWSLLTNIETWTTFSDMYSDLRWEGNPWAVGSALVGQLNYPIVVSGRYVIKDVQSSNAGSVLVANTGRWICD